MSKFSDQFRLDVPLDDALWACREAVVHLDWPLVEAIEPRRLLVKKGLRFGAGSLSSVEIALSEEGPDATTVTMNGSYPGGIGRWDERTLRSLLNSVRNAVEVAAQRSSKQD